MNRYVNVSWAYHFKALFVICIDPLYHERSQNFFWGGTLFQKILKKFSKNIQKTFKKIQKIFKNTQKISKNFKKYSTDFRKFLKIFLRKMLKMHYFSIVFSQFNKARGQFLRVWTKNATCRKFLRKFWKNFLKKIVKNALF